MVRIPRSAPARRVRHLPCPAREGLSLDDTQTSDATFRKTVGARAIYLLVSSAAAVSRSRSSTATAGW